MKKILSIFAIGLLILGLSAGLNIALADRGSGNDIDNSGPGSQNSDRGIELADFDEDDSILIDNSGPGSLNSGRDESDELDELDEVDLNEVDEPELEIKNGHDIEVKGAAVTSVDNDSFTIALFGMTFDVMVSVGTEFDEDLMLADLLVGDIVKVEGMLDLLNHHVIHAGEVEINI